MKTLLILLATILLSNSVFSEELRIYVADITTTDSDKRPAVSTIIFTAVDPATLPINLPGVGAATMTVTFSGTEAESMSCEITKGIAISNEGTMSDRRVFYTFLPIRLDETFRLLNNEFGSIDLSIKLVDTKKK